MLQEPAQGVDEQNSVASAIQFMSIVGFLVIGSVLLAIIGLIIGVGSLYRQEPNHRAGTLGITVAGIVLTFAITVIFINIFR